MKVAFLVKDLNIKNGWGSYSFYLTEALKKQGTDIVVVKSDKSFFEIRKSIKECDIVHCLTEPSAFMGALLKGSRPFFVTAHGTYAVEPLDKLSLSSLKLRYAYNKARAIICVSHFTESEIEKRIPEANTIVINNGVDFNKFQIESFTRLEILDNHYPIILGVGALKSRKGYHIAIQAVAGLKEQFPNFLYIISGEQSNVNYFNKLKELVKNYNLDDNVKFIEADDEEIIKLYRSADLFLLTPINENSHFEGFGLVYLEAGACGVASVGSKNCGAEDAIKDEKTGFLVEQNNVKNITEAVLKILSDKDLNRKLSDNARNFAKFMSWEKIVKELTGVYRKALSK